MPFSTRDLHQVSVEPIISPQMLYQGSYSPAGRFPAGPGTAHTCTGAVCQHCSSKEDRE